MCLDPDKRVDGVAEAHGGQQQPHEKVRRIPGGAGEGSQAGTELSDGKRKPRGAAQETHSEKTHPGRRGVKSWLMARYIVTTL